MRFDSAALSLSCAAALAGALMMCLSCRAVDVAAAAGVTVERWVAPGGVGRGDGSSGADAAAANDEAFWRGVAEGLQHGSVRVQFISGRYTQSEIRLTEIGHADHTLFLVGAADGSSVFEELPGEDQAPGTGLFFKTCRNIHIRDLHFTGEGHIGYITQMSNCRDMLWENCSWIDMPHIRFGASGTTGSKTRNVVYRACTFKRIGVHGGAHMIYNAYEPQHVYVINCEFEDCAGDYVRWRDGTDYAAAIDCRFTSTGTWPPNKPVHQPFLSVPLFADKDPGDEFFGTHFLITGNTFVVQSKDEASPGTMIRFYHSGYDPPGKRHLLTPAEGEILTRGSVEQRRALLKTNCGLDFEQIAVFGNTLRGPIKRATFRSVAKYGAESRGWESTVPVDDLFNVSEEIPAWVLPQ